MQTESADGMEHAPSPEHALATQVLEDAALETQIGGRLDIDEASDARPQTLPRPPPLSEKGQKLLGGPRDVTQIRAVYSQTRKEIAPKTDSDSVLTFQTVAKELRAAVKKVKTEKQVVKEITTEYTANTKPMPDLRKGILTVRILAAHFLSPPSEEKPNPYVMVAVGSSTQRGSTCESTSNPKWKKHTDARQFSFMIQAEETHRYLVLEILNDGLDEKPDEHIGLYELDVHSLNYNSWHHFRDKIIVDGEPDRDKEIEFLLRFAPEAAARVVVPAKEEKKEEEKKVDSGVFDPHSITVADLEASIQATLLRVRKARTDAIQRRPSTSFPRAVHRPSQLEEFERRYRLALEREKERSLRHAQMKQEVSSEEKKRSVDSPKTQVTFADYSARKEKKLGRLATTVSCEFNTDDLSSPKARLTLVHHDEHKLIIPGTRASLENANHAAEEEPKTLHVEHEGTPTTQIDATHRLRQILKKGVELNMLSRMLRPTKHEDDDTDLKLSLTIGPPRSQSLSNSGNVDKKARHPMYVPRPSRGINWHGMRDTHRRSLFPHLIVGNARTKNPGENSDSEKTQASPSVALTRRKRKPNKRRLGRRNQSQGLDAERNPFDELFGEVEMEASDDEDEFDNLPQPKNSKAYAALRKSRLGGWQPVTSRKSVVRQTTRLNNQARKLAERFPGQLEQNRDLRELCMDLPEQLRNEMLQLLDRIDYLSDSLCGRVERVEEIHKERIESEDAVGNILAQTSLADCIDPTSMDDGSSSDSEMDSDPNLGDGKANSDLVQSTSLMQSPGRGDRMVATFQALDAIRGSVVTNIRMMSSMVENGDVVYDGSGTSCGHDEIVKELRGLTGSMHAESICRGLQKAESMNLAIANPQMAGLIAELDWRYQRLVQDPSLEPSLAMQRKARQRGIAVARAAMCHQGDRTASDQDHDTVHDIAPQLGTAEESTMRESDMVQLLREGHLEILELKTEEELEVSMASADMAELHAAQLALLDLIKESGLPQTVAQELVPHELIEQGRKMIDDVTDVTRDRFGNAIEAVLAAFSNANGNTSNAAGRRATVVNSRRFARQMSVSMPAAIHRKSLFDKRKASLAQGRSVAGARKSVAKDRKDTLAQDSLESWYSDGLQDISWESSDIIQDDATKDISWESSDMIQEQKLQQMLDIFSVNVDCFDCLPWETQSLMKQEGWPQSLAMNLKKLAIARRHLKDDSTRPRFCRRVAPGPVVYPSSISPSQQSIELGFTSSGHLSLLGSTSKLVSSSSSALLDRDLLATPRAVDAETKILRNPWYVRGISGWIAAIDDAEACALSGSLQLSSDSWPPAMSLLTTPLKPKSPRELEEEFSRSMPIATGQISSAMLPFPKHCAVGQDGLTPTRSMVSSSGRETSSAMLPLPNQSALGQDLPPQSRKHLQPITRLHSSSGRPRTVPADVGRQRAADVGQKAAPDGGAQPSEAAQRSSLPQKTVVLSEVDRPCTVPPTMGFGTALKGKHGKSKPFRNVKVAIDTGTDDALIEPILKRGDPYLRMMRRSTHAINVDFSGDALPHPAPARTPKTSSTARRMTQIKRDDSHAQKYSSEGSFLNVTEISSNSLPATNASTVTPHTSRKTIRIGSK